MKTKTLILSALVLTALFMMTSIVSAASPVMNSSIINQTIAYANISLVGLCNGSDADPQGITYDYIWYVNNVSMQTGNAGMYISSQEDANFFNYGSPSEWINATKINDGNLNTFGVYNDTGVEDYSSTFYENYTLPSTLYNRTVDYKTKAYYSSAWHYVNTTKYLSAGVTSQLRTRYVMGEVCNPFPTCYSAYWVEHRVAASTWTMFVYDSTYTGEYRLAETSIDWHLAQTGQYQAPTYSGSLSNGQSVKLSCRANDGTSTSSWMNSTPVVISDTNATYLNIEDFSVTPSVVYINTTTYLNVSNVTIVDPDYLESYYFVFTYHNLNDSTIIANFTNASSNSFTIPANNSHDRIMVKLWSYNLAQGKYEYLTNRTFNISNSVPVINSITAVYAESNVTSNITLSYVGSDLDDNDSINYSIKWYHNGVLNLSFNNLTFINGSVLVGGHNYTASVAAYDGYVWSNYTNSSIVTVGDTNAPVLSGDSLSSSSGVNNAPFTIYLNVAEINQVVYVYVQITDPNGASLNYSMTPGNLAGAQTKTYTPSTDGAYHFKFYSRDGSGNRVAYASSITHTDSTTSSPGGGGGGSITKVVIDNSAIDDIVNSKLKGYITFAYPGDTVYVPYLPISKLYQREVIITAKTGPVNATANFSSEISEYFTAEICDIYTGECARSMIIKENEQKYLKITANLSNQDFANQFISEGFITGSVNVLSAGDAGPNKYNVEIKKKTMFEPAIQWRDYLNSNQYSKKALDLAGLHSLNQKNAYYLIYASFMLGALISLFLISLFI